MILGPLSSALRPRARPLLKQATRAASNAELFVILMVVGAALSNMFVARRFQSYQHIKAPKSSKPGNASYAADDKETPNNDDTAAGGNKKMKQLLEEELREHNIGREYKRIWNSTEGSGLEKRPTVKFLPLPVLDCLKKLKLPQQPPTREEVKKQHRILALRYHPDTNGGGDTAEKFKSLQKAYGDLLNYFDKL